MERCSTLGASPASLAKDSSLEDLVKTASLLKLLRSNFKDSDFSALDPRLLEPLFGRIRKEYQNLRKEADMGTLLRGSIPYADLRLYTGETRLATGSDEDESSSTDEEDPDPYTIQDSFREKWSLSKDYSLDFDSVWTEGSRDRSVLTWHSEKLYWNIPSGDLMLDEEPWARTTVPGYQFGQDKGFTHRISSQLLLYRLIVMFGMIPPQTEGYVDRYKSCWECVLVHADGKSRMTVYDWKGWGSVQFKGSEEGSRDALELLNFVCGERIPHSYDFVLAGAKA